ncbi:MAG TPA: DoxX family membrane protein [Polyangiales bacterium]|jgi:uncharacterized membrane protein YphA (DoxX/SURF4 family)
MNDRSWFVLASARVLFGWTLLRIVTGALLLVDGLQELVAPNPFRDGLASWPMVSSIASIATWSCAAQIAGGVGLLLGLLTPWAGFAALVSQLVALASAIASLGWAPRQGVDVAVALATGSFVFWVCGAGPCSLDALWFARASGAPALIPLDPSLLREPNRELAEAARDPIAQARIDLSAAATAPLHSRRMH